MKVSIREVYAGGPISQDQRTPKSVNRFHFEGGGGTMNLFRRLKSMTGRQRFPGFGTRKMVLKYPGGKGGWRISTADFSKSSRTSFRRARALSGSAGTIVQMGREVRGGGEEKEIRSPSVTASSTQLSDVIRCH